MEDLQQAFSAVSTRMYEQAGAAGQPGPGPEEGPQPGPAPGGPDVIDAEFEAEDK